MRISSLLVSAVLGLGVRPAQAASAGAEPYNFLFLDANARAVALGGAYTALADDANALLYNPGGLGLLNGHEATFMHNQYVDELTKEYGGLAYDLGNWGGAGLNVNYLSFNRIAKTRYDLPDGTGLGEFGLSDLAVSMGYGYRVMENLGVGLSYKYLREVIDNLSASGHAADLGVLFRPFQALTLGFSAQNLGPPVRFQGPKEELPVNFRWGGAYRFDLGGFRNTFSADLTKARSGKAVVNGGLESVMFGMMPVRVGYSSRNDAGPGVTAGVGWLHRGMRVDYAFVPYGDLGFGHRVSAAFRWGGTDEAPPRRAAPAPAERTSVEESQDKAPAKPKPMTPEKHFEKAEEYIKESSYLDAKAELHEAAKALPDDDERRIFYYERLGRVSFLQGEISKAKSSFSEALRLAVRQDRSGSDVANAYAGMGECLAKENNVSYALKFFSKALEAKPSPKTRKFVQEQLKLLQR